MSLFQSLTGLNGSSSGVGNNEITVAPWQSVSVGGSDILPTRKKILTQLKKDDNLANSTTLRSVKAAAENLGKLQANNVKLTELAKLKTLANKEKANLLKTQINYRSSQMAVEQTVSSELTNYDKSVAKHNLNMGIQENLHNSFLDEFNANSSMVRDAIGGW